MNHWILKQSNARDSAQSILKACYSKPVIEKLQRITSCICVLYKDAKDKWLKWMSVHRIHWCQACPSVISGLHLKMRVEWRARVGVGWKGGANLESIHGFPPTYLLTYWVKHSADVLKGFLNLTEKGLRLEYFFFLLFLLVPLVGYVLWPCLFLNIWAQLFKASLA